jgi:acyl transferase domain-containing protein/acyl carrier protein
VLRGWGIAPAAVVGHSVGEVAAAHIVGALDLDDAVRLSYHRSRLQARAAGHGRMLAVGLSEEEVLAKLRSEPLIEIAAINGPKSITLAGDGPALERLAQALSAEGVFNRFLVVEVAYHSRDMEPIRDELLASLADLRPQSASIPFYSTVTGKIADGKELDASYWYRNVRQAVRFADGVDRLLADGFDLFLEVGPHPALSTSVTQCLRRRSSTATVVPTLQRKKPDPEALHETLAQLFVVGYPVEWKMLYPRGGRRLRLPAYPWQREYHWRESDESKEDRFGSTGHPLLGLTVKSPQPTREAELTGTMFPYLADHRIQGHMVFPGAGYVETALALGLEAANDGRGNASGLGSLEDVEFQKLLMIDPAAEVSFLRASYEAEQGRILIHSRMRTSTNWTLHAAAKFLPTKPEEATILPLDELRRRIGEEVAPAEMYASLRKQGLEYGPAFQGMQRLWRNGSEILAQLTVRDTTDLERYIVHPSLLDAAFQTLAIAAADNEMARGGLYLPVGIDRLRVHARPGASAWVVGRVTRCNARLVEGDLELCDDTGRVLVAVRGVRFQSLPAEQGGATGNLLYNFRWRRAEAASATPIASIKQPTLILADRDGIGGKLAEELTKRGDAPIVLTLEGAARERQRLAETLAATGWPGRIVCLWGLDVPSADQGLTATPSDPGVAVTALFQVLATASRGSAPRLWIVTRGAQAVEGEAPTTPAAATLWGLGRVLAAEHPDLRCSLADIDSTDGAIAALADELLADGPEPELAFRSGARFVRRAERLTQLPDPIARTTEDEADPSVRLEVGRRGGLDSLRFRRNPAREPGPGEVTVRVRAAGLNFKDVLKAMGVLSERIVDGTMSGQMLGLECAGTIARVGPGVERFRVGDDVVACAADCFRSHLTLSSDMVFAKIPGLSFAEEAALPVVFLTAHYSLNVIGRLQRGERVLIHAGTGGVGLAALQVARRAGAEVFATAGSPEKREFLRSLGVEHVMDSRSLEFADQIMEKTGGYGVDVVLNSLTGQALLKSLAILAPYGRFIEIGKRDIDENNALRLRPFNRNLSFSSIDIDRLIVERPKQARELMEEVRTFFRTGDFKPLPVQVFSAAQATDAFRHLGQAKHIGKVVLSLEDAVAASNATTDDEPSFRADATYLVTGGLGGVGLKLAEWLAEHGARHLLLVGRSGAATPEARRVVRTLERRGIAVQAVAADVSRRADIDSLLAHIPASAPLRGVFHAAMVLDDVFALQLDRERYERVLAPKALGAWNLHVATEKFPLDHFVLFSSVVAELGNPGQGAYAAANSFLDSLAAYRRSRGLAGLSVNWGAFADAGVLARNEQLATHLTRQGWTGITVQRAFDSLAAIMNRAVAQVAIADVDWQAWGRAAPTLANSPRFADLVAKAAGPGGDGLADANWRAELLAMEPEQRLGAVQQRVREGVAQVLGLDPAKVDPQRRLDQLGLASLMAVELQHVLRQRTGIEVSAMDMMQGPSVADLSKVLLGRLIPAPQSEATTAGAAPASDSAAPAPAGSTASS